MTEWIKCADKMPYDYDWVLVCRLAKGTGEPSFISIATYRDGMFLFDCDQQSGDQLMHYATSYWMDVRDHLESDEITHWMPLPEAPHD